MCMLTGLRFHRFSGLIQNVSMSTQRHYTLTKHVTVLHVIFMTQSRVYDQHHMVKMPPLTEEAIETKTKQRSFFLTYRCIQHAFHSRKC